MADQVSDSDSGSFDSSDDDEYAVGNQLDGHEDDDEQRLMADDNDDER